MSPESADILRNLVVRGAGFVPSGRASMWLYERKLIAPVRAGTWVATEAGVAALPRVNPRPGKAAGKLRSADEKAVARAAKVSPAELKRLKDIYTDMHWGAKPTKLIHVRDPLVPNLVAYGALTEIKTNKGTYAFPPGCWLGFDPKKTRRLYIVLSPAGREMVRKASKYAGKAYLLQGIAKRVGGPQAKNPMPKLNGYPIGVIEHVVYRTEKLGEDVPGQSDYIHEFGKEHSKGMKPILAADASGRLHFCGSSYRCLPAGITG